MRRFAILGFVAAVLLGLASRKLGPTGFALWDKSFGDADYAVMFGSLLLALRPTLSALAIGLGAFGICSHSSSFNSRAFQCARRNR